MSDLANPGSSAAVVTPSDTANLSPACRALYIGGAGDVTLLTVGNNNASVLFTAVPAGSILPVRAARVMSTGTTATAIVALW